MTNEIAMVSSTVCKTVRSMGLSPERTHTVVDGIQKMLENNGVAYVLEKVKSWKQYFADPTQSPPAWSRKVRRFDGLARPKGFLGALTGHHTKRETVIALLGTVQTAVIFGSVTEEQFEKFSKAVLNPPTPTATALEPVGLEEFAPGLEQILKRKWSDRPFFGPGDIEGCTVPVGKTVIHIMGHCFLDENGKVISRKVARAKKKEGINCATVQFPDKGKLFRAWSDTCNSADSAVWTFLTNIQYEIPGIRPDACRVLFNAMRKDALDSGKRHTRTSKGKSRTKVDRKVDLPIGTITFMQKPGGKLRSVANPNRLAQWCNEPLGEALSDWVNSQPGVFVKNQEAAIAKVQQWLQQGELLVSSDLSSASDTMDYRLVMAPLFRQSGSSLTRKSMDFFEHCSRGQWYLNDDKARAFHGSDCVRWKQGQPLGLRPSFAIMTICNLAAAEHAAFRTEGNWDRSDPPWAIVGDDIVMKAKIAPMYAQFIASIGGISNADKCMASSTQAEICSRLVTANSVTRLKPRWLEDDPFQNVLTYQGTGLQPRIPNWVKKTAKRLGSYALRESGLVPPFNPNESASLSLKNLVNAYLSSDRSLETPDPEKISMETLYRRGLIALPKSSSKAEINRLSAKELVKMLEGMNSTLVENGKFPDLWKEALYRTVSKSGRQSVNVLLMKHALSQDEGKAAKRKVRDYILNLIYDPIKAQTLYPSMKFPRIEGNEYEDSQRLWQIPLSEQNVTARSEYDYKLDQHVVVQNPTTSMQKLDRKIQSAVKDVITEVDGSTHLIQRVSTRSKSAKDAPDIDLLIEDKGDSYELSYHSKKTSTQPIKLPRVTPMVKGEKEAPNVGADLVESFEPIPRSIQHELNQLRHGFGSRDDCLGDAECSSDEDDVLDVEI